MRMLLVLVLVLVVGLVGAAAPAAEARTYCGKVTTRYSYGSYQHKTYLIKGKLSCKSVRSVLKKSIPLNDEAKGWSCIKRDQPVYDVTCTKGSIKVGAITEL
jgi:hypothetical protein